MCEEVVYCFIFIRGIFVCIIWRILEINSCLEVEGEILSGKLYYIFFFKSLGIILKEGEIV